ncbi:plasmid mobilization relaxosome protein MobC, partial [Enterococcus faecalis]|nr:plasmid mobilization relaxosome protein MobC [Enterococcus faecalis]
KIGININQMARLANQFHEISSEDIKDLTDKVQSLNALVQSELNKLIKRKEQS